MEIKGINGYSLQGPSGNSGENGRNIFFCSYGINSHNSDEEHGENEDLVNEFISQNKALSNNNNITETVYYRNGDIILDSNGDLYKIENGKISSIIGSIFDDETSESSSEHHNITATWNIVDDSSIKILNNYNYKSTNSVEQSPFYIHRDSHERKVPAHQMSVVLECKLDVKHIKITVVIDDCVEHVVSKYDPLEENVIGDIRKYKIDFWLEKRYFTSSPKMEFSEGGMPSDDDYEYSKITSSSIPSNRIQVYVDFTDENKIYSIKATKQTQHESSNENE